MTPMDNDVLLVALRKAHYRHEYLVKSGAPEAEIKSALHDIEGATIVVNERIAHLQAESDYYKILGVVCAMYFSFYIATGVSCVLGWVSFEWFCKGTFLVAVMALTARVVIKKMYAGRRIPHIPDR